MNKFTRTSMSLGLAAGVGITAPSGPAMAADNGAEYFKGKTIEWVIGSAPGGGHDFFARLFAQHFEKGLPGVNVVNRNRPGAGHIIAANLVYAAPPNGLTIGSFSTGLVYSQIQNRKGIRFDLGKMSWVGKAQSDWRAASVAATSEFKSFDDILNAKREIKFSASGVGAGSYNDSFMIAKAYNIPSRIITGYSGSSAALGLMRKETDILMGGLSSAEGYARAGQVKIILQFGKALPGIPDAADYAKTPLQKALSLMMENQGKLSRITAGPPEVVPERLAALREAYRVAVNDKDFIEQAKKAGYDPDPLIGEDVRQAIVSIMNQPPAILDMLKGLANVKVEMAKHEGKVTQVKNGGRQIYISHEGKDVWAKISGSRTKITVDGKTVKRDAVKVGMTCTFTYPRANTEAQSVDCKG